MIAPREYLDLVSNFMDSTGCRFLSCGKVQLFFLIIITMSQIATGVDIMYPENPKYVRGWNYPSGMLCLPVSGYVCKQIEVAIGLL